LLEIEIFKKGIYAFVNKTQSIDSKTFSLALKFINKYKIKHLNAYTS
jgi:tRNA A37 threonylcarbamoyladenosine biosynthesis protein TsaE